MKVLITLGVCVLIISMISIFLNVKCSETETETDICAPDNSVFNVFKLGPVLLKVDNEWLFEEEHHFYLKIGFLRDKSAFSKLNQFDYALVSPKSLSSETSVKSIFAEKLCNKKEEIVTYNIEIQNNQIWIDLDLVLFNDYDSFEKKINTNLADNKDLYFFHPKKKKWWGLHYSYSNPEPTIMYDDIYIESNTKQDVEDFLKKAHGKKFMWEIINKRIFNLPSMKFYEEKFGDLIEEYRLFCWYVEKEEIEPKNNDDE